MCKGKRLKIDQGKHQRDGENGGSRRGYIIKSQHVDSSAVGRRIEEDRRKAAEYEQKAAKYGKKASEYGQQMTEAHGGMTRH